MTAMTAAPAEAFVPTGNPVRRFLIVLGSIALLAGLLWASALAAPRLSVSVEPKQLHDGINPPRRGALTFGLHNEGPFAIELRAVQSDNAAVEVANVRVDGRPLSERHRIGGGATAVLTARFAVDCTKSPLASDGYVSDGQVLVTVATAVGVRRTEQLDQHYILPMPSEACRAGAGPR
jgi:hypothetical protein